MNVFVNNMRETVSAMVPVLGNEDENQLLVARISHFRIHEYK